MPKRRHLLNVLLITLLTLGIYVNTLSNGFVYDDKTVLGSIKHVEDLKKLFSSGYFRASGEASYRPVVTFTYFIDYSLFEFSAWGYHLTNIVLHALNGVLFYIFLHRASAVYGLFSESRFPILVTCVLFTTHPVLTEAVNVISYREDLLVFFFLFLSFNLYLLLTTADSLLKNSIIYTLSCICYALALFSKEMAAVFPLLLFLWGLLMDKMDISVTTINKLRKSARDVSGYAVATALYLLIYTYYFNPVEKFSSVEWTIKERLITLPGTLLKYVKLAIMPFSLSADYPVFPISKLLTIRFIMPFIMLLIISLLIYRLSQSRKTNHRLASFGMIFFFVALLPVSNIVPICNPMAERYLYLPMAGVAIAAGGFFCFCQKHHMPALLVLPILIIMNNSAMTVDRNKIWENDLIVWSDTVKKIPKSSRGHFGLGNAYKNMWHVDDAIREYEVAKKINPHYVENRFNLGSCYMHKGLLDKAQLEYAEVLRMKPRDLFAAYRLGEIYFDRGLYQQAMDVCRRILTLNPNDRYAVEMMEIIQAKLSAYP